MILIGLTGGIASGKSTVTKMIRESGMLVWDYDAEVHALYENPPDSLWALFYDEAPDCITGSKINRSRVSEIYFTNPKFKQRIDKSVTTILEDRLKKWASVEKTLFLDVPLIYELGWDRYCEAIWVVSCHPAQQRERALARGMTEEKLDLVLSYQKSPAEYIELAKKKSHLVIDTSQTIEFTRDQVKVALTKIIP